MLQDVQERLVYRTSVYIRSDILGYAPAPGDLAYPEKLEMMEAIAEQLAAKEEERRGHSRQNSSSSVVSATSMEVGALTSGGAKIYSGTSPADLHGMWYPPVRRALLTLSKLYRCLEKPIFTGLSQEVENPPIHTPCPSYILFFYRSCLPALTMWPTLHLRYPMQKGNKQVMDSCLRSNIC